MTAIDEAAARAATKEARGPKAETAEWNLDFRTALVRIAAAASALCGAIHYSVIPEHRAEWWVFAAFFTLLGAFEFVWAALVWADAGRRLLWIGALVNAATLAVWTASRTTGLPFGPDSGHREAVGALDVVACIAELATIVLALWAMSLADRGFADADAVRESVTT